MGAIATKIGRRRPPLEIHADQELAERALNTLKKLGIDAIIGATQPNAQHLHWHPDFAVTLRRKAKRVAYLVEVKRTLRPTTLGSVLLRLRNLKQPALLLTEYVTPNMAQLLRDAGVAFADIAGNAFIEFAGDIFYVVGNVPEQRPRAEKVVRAFQPTGLRVVFALLCMPKLIELPTRELAAKLKVANGTVGRVLDDLTHLGFVTITGRRNRQLHNLQGLLERWVMMYPAQLRPTLLRRRLTADAVEWWKAEKFDARVTLGGQPAAAVLTKYLKPGTTTIFVRGEPKPFNEMVVRNHLRTDPTGAIEMLDAFWPTELPTDKPGLAPTVLIYADLLATGDARCIETAKRLYDNYLAKRFTQT